MKMEKMEEAKKEFRTIIAVNPNLADAHHSLGIIAYERGRLRGGGRAASPRPCSSTPTSPTPGTTWATPCMELSRFAEAKDAFATCVRRWTRRTPQCLQQPAPSPQRKAALTDTALKEMQDTQHGGEHRPGALHARPAVQRARACVAEEERAYKKCLRLDAQVRPLPLRPLRDLPGRRTSRTTRHDRLQELPQVRHRGGVPHRDRDVREVPQPTHY